MKMEVSGLYTRGHSPVSHFSQLPKLNIDPQCNCLPFSFTMRQKTVKYFCCCFLFIFIVLSLIVILKKHEFNQVNTKKLRLLPS